MTAVARVSKLVRATGRALGDLLEDIGKQLRFYVEILFDILRIRRVFFKYNNVIINLVSDITIGAGALIVGGGMIFVIFSMSFFTGTEVGLQGFKGLQQIGAESFTGLIGSFANTREVTPLIAGVAFAAQVGAGFTAELGAMRISEEIDALEVMSVPSKAYLVATRVVAALIAIVPLYLISLFASFFATQLVSTKFFGLSPGVYNYYFRLYLPPIDIFYSLLKACLFAVVVALIHCYYGYYASGGPAGVGVAVGRAIRLSIVCVVVLNLVLSLIFWGGGNTVSLTG
jgi:phospholipid/cholesterol/gamma-HCH transport system permease protein